MADAIMEPEPEQEVDLGSNSDLELEVTPVLGPLERVSESESQSDQEEEVEEVIQDDRDNRVEIHQQDSLPYKWICYLKIKREGHSKPFRGSGFKINFPHVNRTVVITAGHCVWDNENERFAEKITVTFPGHESPTDCYAANFYVPLEYKDERHKDYDYGMIIYDGASNKGFGWTTEITDQELMDMDVTNCGYPKEKSKRIIQPGNKFVQSMWITGGKITNINKYQIFYKNDTTGGQSGSPIYGWYQGFWVVVGIHTHGSRHQCINLGRRFDLQMISRFMKKINCKKVLNSAKVQIRCEQDGTVNCQPEEPNDLEQFYIYPVAMTPSVAPENILLKVVIESAKWENAYITLDSTGMTSTEAGGGGDVSWKYEFGPKATFYLKKEKGDSDTYSFISAKDPHFRIRVDGGNEDAVRGVGNVNCQFYQNRQSRSIQTPYAENSDNSYDDAKDSEKIRIITTS